MIERVLDKLFDTEILPFGKRWRIAGSYSSPDTKRTGLIRLPWLKDCGVYVHRIDTPDNDRHLHNHPYSFGSFILSGHQIQGTLTPDGVKNEWLRPPRYYYMPRERFHRVQALPFGPCWTLFLAGKPQWMVHPDTKKQVHLWGMSVDGKFVDWVTYRKMTGRE